MLLRTAVVAIPIVPCRYTQFTFWVYLSECKNTIKICWMLHANTLFCLMFLGFYTDTCLPDKTCVAASCLALHRASLLGREIDLKLTAEMKMMSAPFLGISELFSSLSLHSTSTAQHILLFLMCLSPPSPWEPCRLCIKARVITFLELSRPLLNWNWGSLSIFFSDEPQSFWGQIISLICAFEWGSWTAGGGIYKLRRMMQSFWANFLPF